MSILVVQGRKWMRAESWCFLFLKMAQEFYSPRIVTSFITNERIKLGGSSFHILFTNIACLTRWARGESRVTKMLDCPMKLEWDAAIKTQALTEKEKKMLSIHGPNWADRTACSPPIIAHQVEERGSSLAFASKKERSRLKPTPCI